MARHRGTERCWELIAGRVSLDFVNTLSWRGTERPLDRLQTVRDLLSWAEAAGVLSRERAVELASRAERSPRAAKVSLEQARLLREALHGLFSRWSRKRPASPVDLQTLNAVLTSAPERRRLRWSGDRFEWDWRVSDKRFEQVLWPVAWSAADLLAGDDRERIKACAGEGCGWLFFDTSRNRSRRWCSMADCGNRAKARRHYARSSSPRSRRAAGKRR